MIVKQVSIFIQNTRGRLSKVVSTLSKAGINIRALSIADTKDYGVLRLIVNDYEAAQQVLTDNNFMAIVSDVIAIAVSDDPGGLSAVLDFLDDKDISVEYMYAYIGKTDDNAMVILRTDEPQKALDALADSDIRVLYAKDVYNM